MVIEALVGLGVAGAILVYKRWGRKYVKKYFDDPTTEEDESRQIDGFAQDVIKIAVTEAIKAGSKEAMKNPQVDKAVAATEHLVERMKGSMSHEEAKKLVDAALGRK